MFKGRIGLLMSGSKSVGKGVVLIHNHYFMKYAIST